MQARHLADVAVEPLFSLSIDILAPAERVFEVMSDVERWHEWTPSVNGVKLQRPGALAVGARALIRQPKFPPALWAVTAIETGRSFTWVSRAPGVRVIAHHSAAPTSSGSRATLSLRYEGILGGLLAWMTAGITKRYLFMEAGGLKARAENPLYRHGR